MNESQSDGVRRLLDGLSTPRLDISQKNDGTLLLRHPDAPKLSGKSLPSMLRDNARDFPDRDFLIENNDGRIERITFGEFFAQTQELAEGLISLGLEVGSVCVVFTENSISSALLSLAILSAGGIVAPMAPQLLDVDPETCVKTCEDLQAWAVISDKQVMAFCERSWFHFAINTSDGHALTPNQIKRASTGRNALPARIGAISAETTAKIMFTSGSTGQPKPVIVTHGMMSSAQDISKQMFEGMQEYRGENYKLTDWLPWHHTYGGNANFNSVVWEGGSLRIDAGRPMPTLFEETIASIKSHPPTLFVGVPASFAMLADALENDQGLADVFFRSVTALINGGAALSPAIIDVFQGHAIRVTGEPIHIGGGYGMTETCAMITQVYWANPAPDTLGLPPPGVELKLVPIDEARYECRVKGPNVTPGYYHPEGQTNSGLFDEDGYLITGDSLKFHDPEQPLCGLVFAGRLKEEFKLSTGTWVKVGELRSELVDALSPLVNDVVIVGENRGDVRALVWLKSHASLIDISERLKVFADPKRGRSRCITHAAPLAREPDPQAGELQAKGSINQLKMRQNRIAEIEALYEDP